MSSKNFKVMTVTNQRVVTAKNIQTAVTYAVEHLHELSSRMSSIDVFNTFKDDDVTKIDKLIVAIQELEKERRKVHELYETETIKASKLRHQLLGIPDDTEREAEAAVTSARESNAETMKRLSEQLASTKGDIAYLEKKRSELEAENTVLHPEREMIRQEHEEIISQLNQRMADKAAMQITLNETRDKVRQTNASILELEDGIIKLKDDLIEERTAARQEKKRLKREVADTTQKIKEQKGVNAQHKEVFEDLKLQNTEWLSKVSELKKSIGILSGSYDALCNQSGALERRLKMLKEENDVIRKKGESLVEEDIEVDRDFKEQKKRNEELYEKYKAEKEKALEKQDRLQDYLDSLTADFNTKKSELNELLSKLDSKKKALKTLKDELATRAEQVGNLQEENSQMEAILENYKDTHTAVIGQLNSQVEDFRATLNKERTERIALQTKREDITKDLDSFKTDTHKFMAEVNKKIHSGKVEHVELTNEGVELQQKLLDDANSIRSLQEQLTKVEDDFQTNEVELSHKLEDVQTSVDKMQKLHDEKQTEHTSKLPDFTDYEDTYNQQSDAYSQMKKDLAEKKNKRNKLMAEIETLKKEKRKIMAPRDELNRLLQEKRAYSLEKMKQNMAETKEIESRICETGCHLKKIIEENYKFEQGNEKISCDVQKCQKDTCDTQIAIRLMEDEFERLKKQLLEGWQEDKDLQEETEVRDNRFVRELGSLMNKTGGRAEMINELTEKLEAEIGMLASFMNKVMEHRPADTPGGDELIQQKLPQPALRDTLSVIEETEPALNSNSL